MLQLFYQLPYISPLRMMLNHFSSSNACSVSVFSKIKVFLWASIFADIIVHIPKGCSASSARRYGFSSAPPKQLGVCIWDVQERQQKRSFRTCVRPTRARSAHPIATRGLVICNNRLWRADSFHSAMRKNTTHSIEYNVCQKSNRLHRIGNISQIFKLGHMIHVFSINERNVKIWTLLFRRKGPELGIACEIYSKNLIAYRPETDFICNKGGCAISEVYHTARM